jgi:chemotaxis protein MotA
MDIGSLLGILMSFGLILGGNAMEGGHLDSLWAPTALMIVIGGTAGACVLQFPFGVTIASLKSLISIFLPKKVDPRAIIVQLVDFAKRARREGILALEKEIENIKDPFFAKALRMAVDGLEPKQLVETMETELGMVEEKYEGPVKFWEACGGYAPTCGILGAVLGLIHVMSKLDDPSQLGSGIALAFVATVYGVGFANLVFLPFSTKLKLNARNEVRVKEIVLKGVLLIQEGINHGIIEEQLLSYLDEKLRAKYIAAQKAAPAAKE